MPFPPSDGGAQLMHFTTKALLANNIDVKTLAINPTRNFINVETLPREYVSSTKFEAVKINTKINLLNLFLNLFKKESYFIERFFSKEFEHKLKSILESESYDIVHLEHLYLCKYIDAIREVSDARILLRPQNVEFIIWERYLKCIKNPFKKMFLKTAIRRLKKYEQNVNDQLDGIAALTQQDADIFSSFSDTIPVTIVPMGYDYERLTGYDFHKQYHSSPVVYHLGSMDWLPNVEAVRWFLNQVLPILNQTIVSFKITIAGSNMPKWVYRYQSKEIEISGNIGNPLEFQEDKAIMIIPLWSGSGIRAKIIEGLALGKTIISTTIGAQGIEYENGKDILIADTPEEFAEQIIRCIKSPELCRKVGQNARSLSVRRYQSDNTAKAMIGFYHQLLETDG
jgi:glycosyltransferase involved in cell wall biosynthesis